MTIDEAIEHAEERACGNDQCAKDHTQLADWLRELRRARMEIDLLKTLRDGFKADAQKYKAENAELRELADAVKEFVEDTHCEDCPCRRDCDDNNRIFCANKFSYHAFAAMRELGIEVDG